MRVFCHDHRLSDREREAVGDLCARLCDRPRRSFRLADLLHLSRDGRSILGRILRRHGATEPAARVRFISRIWHAVSVLPHAAWVSESTSGSRPRPRSRPCRVSGPAAALVELDKVPVGLTAQLAPSTQGREAALDPASPAPRFRNDAPEPRALQPDRGPPAETRCRECGCRFRPRSHAKRTAFCGTSCRMRAHRRRHRRCA